MSKLYCPNCKRLEHAAIYASRNIDLDGVGAVLRYRRCHHCGGTYKTFEVEAKALMAMALKELEGEIGRQKKKESLHQERIRRELHRRVRSVDSSVQPERGVVPDMQRDWSPEF